MEKKREKTKNVPEKRKETGDFHFERVTNNLTINNLINKRSEFWQNLQNQNKKRSQWFRLNLSSNILGDIS